MFFNKTVLSDSKQNRLVIVVKLPIFHTFFKEEYYLCQCIFKKNNDYLIYKFFYNLTKHIKIKIKYLKNA